MEEPALTWFLRLLVLVLRDSLVTPVQLTFCLVLRRRVRMGESVLRQVAI